MSYHAQASDNTFFPTHNIQYLGWKAILCKETMSKGTNHTDNSRIKKNNWKFTTLNCMALLKYHLAMGAGHYKKVLGKWRLEQFSTTQFWCHYVSQEGSFGTINTSLERRPSILNELRSLQACRLLCFLLKLHYFKKHWTETRICLTNSSFRPEIYWPYLRHSRTGLRPSIVKGTQYLKDHNHLHFNWILFFICTTLNRNI